MNVDSAHPRFVLGGLTGWLLLGLAAAGAGLGLAALLRADSSERPDAAPSPRQLLSLELATTPSGATVTLDGRFAGVSPVQVADVQSGDHTLRLEKVGYEPVTTRLTLTPETRPLHFPLQTQAQGMLRVRTQPAGADVYINGEHRGLTPLTLSGLVPGEYQVQARKVNFEDFSVTAVVVDGETPTLVEGQLVDRLEQYYLEAIRAKPKKISNFTELAHWYFINNQMDQAVEFYRQGLDLSVDQRMDKDARRHEKEIRKHLSWSSGDRQQLNLFREKMKAIMASHHNLRYKRKRR